MTKISDKRDDFRFHIVHLQFLFSNFPVPVYGITTLYMTVDALFKGLDFL